MSVPEQSTPLPNYCEVVHIALTRLDWALSYVCWSICPLALKLSNPVPVTNIELKHPYMCLSQSSQVGATINYVIIFVCSPVDANVVLNMVNNFNYYSVSLSSNNRRPRELAIHCYHALRVAQACHILHPHLLDSNTI